MAHKWVISPLTLPVMKIVAIISDSVAILSANLELSCENRLMIYSANHFFCAIYFYR